MLRPTVVHVPLTCALRANVGPVAVRVQRNASANSCNRLASLEIVTWAVPRVCVLSVCVLVCNVWCSVVCVCKCSVCCVCVCSVCVAVCKCVCVSVVLPVDVQSN